MAESTNTTISNPIFPQYMIIKMIHKVIYVISSIIITCIIAIGGTSIISDGIQLPFYGLCDTGIIIIIDIITFCPILFLLRCQYIN